MSLKKLRNDESTYEQFRNMSLWLAKGFEKEPKTDKAMFQQSFMAVIRTSIFVGWIYAKTLGFLFRKIKGGISMLGRKKKEDRMNPAFLPPHLQQQMQQQAQAYAQMMQAGQPVPPSAGIPVEFPAFPVPMQQPIYPQPVQQPFQPPVQQPVQQPVQPPVAPVRQPVNRPAQPQQMAGSPVQNIFEQLMQADLSIAEYIKITAVRLDKIEEVLGALDVQMNELCNRLNLLQGVQPSSQERIKFQKRK
jgi:hypothetical protein